MILAIPIELKVREFLNKLYLTSRLLHLTKFDIVFGKKSQVYNFFKKNNNVILLSKGGVKSNFIFNKEHLKNNKIMLLDEEGPMFNIGKIDQKIRASKYVVSRCEKFILWGKKDLLVNDSFKKNKNKFPILGHPKFDLLKEPQSKIFEKECKAINKRYTKFVFIASNFNGGDSEIDSDLYYKYYQNSLPKNKRKQNAVFVKKVLNADYINYANMIDLVINLAKKFPKINFIFRPHPRQNIDLVKKRFPRNLKNIFVNYEHTITPWIMNCEYYIHSGCSSVFEASILKKKIIFLVQKNIPARPEIFSKIGYSFTNKKDAIDYLRGLFLNKKKYTNKKSLLDKNVIENSDKKNFSDSFCALINKLNIKSNNYNKIIIQDDVPKLDILKIIKIFIKKIILKSNFGISVLNKINPNLLLTKKYKDKKYGRSSVIEIKNVLNKFVKLQGKKKTYKIKEIGQELYYIKN